MSKTLVKCLRDGCKNYRNENSPMGLCYQCREYLIDTARIIRSTTKAEHKSKADMMQYEYNVCSIKGCKKRSFMRNRCKKHYIEFMKTNTN